VLTKNSPKRSHNALHSEARGIPNQSGVSRLRHNTKHSTIMAKSEFVGQVTEQVPTRKTLSHHCSATRHLWPSRVKNTEQAARPRGNDDICTNHGQAIQKELWAYCSSHTSEVGVRVWSEGKEEQVLQARNTLTSFTLYLISVVHCSSCSNSQRTCRLLSVYLFLPRVLNLLKPKLV
jgi:hypothetical protein